MLALGGNALEYNDENVQCQIGIELGFNCCSPNCEVIYTDEDATWGFENMEWCICLNGNKTTTTTSTKKPCATGTGSYWRVPLCTNRHGKFFYHNHQDDSCKPGDFVCFLPCTNSLPSKTLPTSSTKTLPITSTQSTLISNDSIVIDGVSYCGCEINGEYTNDLKKCEEVASTVGYNKEGDNKEEEEVTSTVMTTTTTIPIPIPITTTTTTTKKPCATGTGSYWRAPLCTNRHGKFFYHNHQDDSCKPGDFVCFLPCTNSLPSKTLPTSSTKTLPITSTPLSNDNVVIDGVSYCGCEINGNYTNNLKKCEEVASTVGYNKEGGNEEEEITSTTTTTTTPIIIPTTKCLPVTVTVTEKERITITEKETVTVTLNSDPIPTLIDDDDDDDHDDDNKKCAAKYAQCGGIGFSGPSCCQSGSTCKKIGDYYHQCM